jgi:hypothetical protein
MQNEKNTRKKNTRWTLTLLIGLFASAAGLLWVWRAGRPDAGGDGVHPAAKRADNGPARPAVPQAGPSGPRAAAAATAAPGAEDVEDEAGAGVAQAPPAAAVEAAGKGRPERPVRRVEVIPGMWTNPPPPSGYSSATERLLNMVVNATLGHPPPPLLSLPPGEDIAKILASDVLVYDGDDEKTVAAKINVAQAKRYLKEYLDEGGTTDGFLKYYHDELKQVFEEWRTAQKYAMDLIKAGDDANALLYVEEQNKDFAKRGIKPIVIPGM